MWPKLHIVLMVTFLFACAPRIAVNEKPIIVPPTWQIKHAVDVPCINLSGEYSLWGEEAPQISSSRLIGVPPSLDAMSGVYVPYNDKMKITYVRIEHQGESHIKVIFFTHDGILKEETIIPSEKMQFRCSPDRIVVIKKSLETKGEATRGTADITDSYFLTEGGELVVHKIIKWADNIFFFFKITHKEEYWVKFNRWK